MFYKKKLFQACNFIKKEPLAQVFFCEFCEIYKNTFFTEHSWGAASLNLSKKKLGRNTRSPTIAIDQNLREIDNSSIWIGNFKKEK